MKNSLWNTCYLCSIVTLAVLWLYLLIIVKDTILLLCCIGNTVETADLKIMKKPFKIKVGNSFEQKIIIFYITWTTGYLGFGLNGPQKAANGTEVANHEAMYDTDKVWLVK